MCHSVIKWAEYLAGLIEKGRTMDNIFQRVNKEEEREIIKVLSYSVQYGSGWTANLDRELKRRSFDDEIATLKLQANERVYHAQMKWDHLRREEIMKQEYLERGEVFETEEFNPPSLFNESILANEISKYEDDLSSLVTAIQKDDDLYRQAIFALNCFRDWLEYQKLKHPEYSDDVRKKLSEYQVRTKKALEKIEQGADQEPKTPGRKEILPMEIFKREIFPAMKLKFPDSKHVKGKKAYCELIGKKYKVSEKTIRDKFDTCNNEQGETM